MRSSWLCYYMLPFYYSSMLYHAAIYYIQFYFDSVLIVLLYVDVATQQHILSYNMASSVIGSVAKAVTTAPLAAPFRPSVGYTSQRLLSLVFDPVVHRSNVHGIYSTRVTK